MLYKKLIRPHLFQKDAETAHDQVSQKLKTLGNVPCLPALLRRGFSIRNPVLEQKLFGLTFENPVGLAAGMDKTGEALLGWQCFGFGFLEAGGFTRFPQIGNEKPRLFRLLKDNAIINRMGFNNPGAVAAAATFAEAAPRLRVPLFLNIGKSKDTPLAQAPEDYAQTFETLYPHGDAFVVNVSSPNTLNLRKLQGKEYLKDILRAIRGKSLRHARAPGEDLKPVLVKIAPDLSTDELDEVLEAIIEGEASGIVATNTTTSREGLIESVNETGGLSGPPLFRRVISIVRYIRARLPALPIIGVGGIHNADAAYDMVLAGANLIQLYTGLVFEGPWLVKEINAVLARKLAFNNHTVSSLHPRVRRG